MKEDTIEELLHKYYTNNIQIHKNVICDVLRECVQKKPKLLVFGLGYDSKLWYNATGKNTFFIENDYRYIDLNKDIPKENVIKYNYDNITVSKSLHMTDEEIQLYKIPEELIHLAPFDMIIIDGPAGYNNEKPGRLLPIYWSTKYLSKSGSVIYIDDVTRPLESYCIDKYLSNKSTEYFTERGGCIKFIV